MDRPSRRTAPSSLLDLDQRAAEVLGVQEQYGLAVGADLRLAVAEHPSTLRLELVPGGDDVVDLVADVVDSTVRISLEELRDRRRLSERLEELDLGVGQHDEDRRHAVLGLRHRVRNLRTERLAIDIGGLGD